MTVALVVGVKRFGKNHARNLIQIGSNLHGINPIKMVVVSRRDYYDAKQTAQELEQEEIKRIGSCHVQIIPEQISTIRDLERVLKVHNPSFTAISTPDEFHHEYTVRALEHGGVLCEKPYVPADGQSLDKVSELEAKCRETGNTFCLDLPMPVIAHHLWNNPELKARFNNAKKVNFYWVTREAASDIIDNLAIHPWSLIPRSYGAKVDCVEVAKDGKKAEISLQLHNPKTGHHSTCNIMLQYGGNFTGFEVDDYLIGIKRQGPINDVLNLQRDAVSEMINGNDNMVGERLIPPVDNPIKELALAVLRKHQIVKLSDVRKSQQFLEDVRNYRR